MGGGGGVEHGELTGTTCRGWTWGGVGAAGEILECTKAPPGSHEKSSLTRFSGLYDYGRVPETLSVD